MPSRVSWGFPPSLRPSSQDWHAWDGVGLGEPSLNPGVPLSLSFSGPFPACIPSSCSGGVLRRSRQRGRRSGAVGAWCTEGRAQRPRKGSAHRRPQGVHRPLLGGLRRRRTPVSHASCLDRLQPRNVGRDQVYCFDIPKEQRCTPSMFIHVLGRTIKSNVLANQLQVCAYGNTYGNR